MPVKKLGQLMEVDHEEKCKRVFESFCLNCEENDFERPYCSSTNNEIPPPLILLISREEKEIYEKYGDYLSFRIYYGLLDTDDNLEEMKSYGVGIFFGKRENWKPLIFGVVLFKWEN